MRSHFYLTSEIVLLNLLFSMSYDEWWNLPVFPVQNTKIDLLRKDHKLQYPCVGLVADLSIPCNIWFTWKDMSEEVRPSHVKDLVKNNLGWHTHYINDSAMDQFMIEVFANTSLLRAYNLINPKLGACRSDIWRIAVLWLHGGVYIDYDVQIKKRFTEVIVN